MSSYEIPVGSLISPLLVTAGVSSPIILSPVTYTNTTLLLATFPQHATPPAAYFPLPLPTTMDMSGSLDFVLYWSGTVDATWEIGTTLMSNGLSIDTAYTNLTSTADANLGVGISNKVTVSISLVGSGLTPGEPAQIRIRRVDTNAGDVSLHRVQVTIPESSSAGILTPVEESVDNTSPVPTDGVNTSWTLAGSPEGGVVLVSRNGVIMRKVAVPTLTDEFSLTGQVVTFGIAPFATETLSFNYFTI